MGLENVVEDILRRGEERKQEILRQGEQERDAATSQASEQIEEHRKISEARTESVLAQMEQQELSSAELESKMALLSAQREVMEGLKAQVLSDIAHYPEDKKRILYGKLMTKARSELGDCYVYSNAADKGLLRLSPGMMDGGVIECRGGLVFESKDRSIRLDYRFEALLEEVWNQKIQEIYMSLFG